VPAGEQGEKRVPSPHFLVHSPKDNVGVVVVEGLRAGTDMLGVITADAGVGEHVHVQNLKTKRW
jgi:hypothetical protein